MITMEKMEKWSHWCISDSARPQREAHPLSGPAAPSFLTAESTAHMLFLAPLRLLQGPALFILKNSCLYNHELTGSACDFQNAVIRYNKGWRDGPGFYRFRGNSETST